MDWISDKIIEILVGVSVIILGWAGWITNQVWGLRTNKEVGEKRDEATMDMLQLILDSSKTYREEIRSDLKDIRLDLTTQHQELRQEIRQDMSNLDSKINDVEKKRSERATDIYKRIDELKK